MDRWAAAAIDGSGVPVLVKGEEKLFSDTHVRLYDGDDHTQYDKGELLLTTHRVVWVDPSHCSAIALALAYVLECKSEEGFRTFIHSFKSPKIILRLRPKINAAAAPHDFCRLSFRRDGGRAEKEVEFFETKLKSAVAAKSWDADGGGDAGVTGGGAPGAAVYGIRGHQQAAEQRRQQGQETITNAFDGSLKGLMEEADKLVRLAKRCTAKINKGGASDSEVGEFQSYLLSMGIADPLTRAKAGAGSAFQTGLAKELGQFLLTPAADGTLAPLAKNNGMLLLHEVYCMYNEARGKIELISPRDLIEACSQFATLGIPMVLHEFASKVIVIRDVALNDDAITAKVEAFVSEHGATSPSQLARGAGISVTLAKEQLLTAEGSGVLCRDDTIDCMRFYPNRFVSEAAR